VSAKKQGGRKRTRSAEAKGGLRSRKWRQFLRGPDKELLDELYVPALAEAVRYDRCCAYFSSSVLAAAARGFGRLITRLVEMGDAAPRPAVRLVVNEELTTEDVRALTEERDLSGLEKALKRRFKNPKDLLTRRRLAMLGWLVREGLLAVRVGVMRRSRGLVHAKFGVVTDTAGDAVVFNGSGNESASGLLANYERLDVFTSWDHPEYHHEYSEEFEALWKDEHPDVHTVTLPEALRLKLIKFAPEEPPVAEPTQAGKQQRLAMLWRFIVEAPFLPNGATACDTTGMVGLWPHQNNVVQEAAEAWPNGRLLCDEVGLGKTIEAIFILRRLMAGRGVKRALLLLPKNLVKQWQGELREKGGLVFPHLEGSQTLVWPDGTKTKMTDLAEALEQDVLLMSRELARLPANAAALYRAEPWDLVLMDEAHAARRRGEEREYNSATLLLELLRQLQLRRRARGILLLSATPMQTHPWEPWDLLAVLGEGGAWLSEFAAVRKYYTAIAALEKGWIDPTKAERAAAVIAADPGFPAPPTGAAALTDVASASRMLAFAPPSKRDELVRWLRKSSPLARRMHRNARNTLRQYHGMGLLDQPPTTRIVDDLVFDYADRDERKVYDSVTDYIDTRFEILEKEKPGKGFVMTIYRRRASSCPYALQRSLERRRDGLLKVIRDKTQSWELPTEDAPEDLDPDDLPEEDTSGVSAAFPQDPRVAREELANVEQVLDALRSLSGRDTKRDKFFEVIRRLTDDGRPVLVFTGYTDTVEYLRESLVSYYGKSVGCYSGGGGEVWDGERWRSVTKDAITRALHDRKLQILICTDAASEGLNLQAAGALINYDLPWNPSRVEQRIGRIDRIGQRHTEVRVVNIYLKDSVDDKVYHVLQERCGLFEHFVGPMQPVLARARRMLTGREPVQPMLLDTEATGTESEALHRETYVEAEAIRPPEIPLVLNTSDIESALLAADEEQGLKVRRNRDGLIEVTGLVRGKVRFSSQVDLLERFDNANPICPHDGHLRALAEKMEATGDRLPLVVGSAQDGPFRASVAHWVGPGTRANVKSLRELTKRIDQWDGEYPDPAEWQDAERAARRQAQKLVRQMVKEAAERERKALERQLQAARIRLQRELGRYLVCASGGTDDLNAVLHRQMSRDIAGAQRLKRCMEMLDGYPEWPEQLRQELNEFDAELTANRRQALVAGSELEAALNDPRWAAYAGPQVVK